MTSMTDDMVRLLPTDDLQVLQVLQDLALKAMEDSVAATKDVIFLCGSTATHAFLKISGPISALSKNTINFHAVFLGNDDICCCSVIFLIQKILSEKNHPWFGMFWFHDLQATSTARMMRRNRLQWRMRLGSPKFACGLDGFIKATLLLKMSPVSWRDFFYFLFFFENRMI